MSRPMPAATASTARGCASTPLFKNSYDSRPAIFARWPIRVASLAAYPAPFRKRPAMSSSAVPTESATSADARVASRGSRRRILVSRSRRFRMSSATRDVGFRSAAWPNMDGSSGDNVQAIEESHEFVRASRSTADECSYVPSAVPSWRRRRQPTSWDGSIPRRRPPAVDRAECFFLVCQADEP